MGLRRAERVKGVSGREKERVRDGETERIRGRERDTERYGGEREKDTERYGGEREKDGKKRMDGWREGGRVGGSVFNTC